MVAFEGWSLPRKSETNENESKQIAYWRPIQGVRKCEKAWKQVRNNSMKKCVPCRSPHRCPPYFLIITAFNYFLTTSYCFILLLTKFVIFCTTRVLLFYYSVPIVFAIVQYVVAVFLLILYYMLTTFYYVVTTYILHAYYLLLHVYYLFTVYFVYYI